MSENALELFAEDLISALSGRIKSGRGLLVKKHSENLHSHGDFSFPNSVKSWHEHLKGDRLSSVDVPLLQYLCKNHSDLVDESANWKLRVKSVKEDGGRVYLFLDRPFAISVGLSEAMRNNESIALRLATYTTAVKTDPLCEQNQCITSLRVRYLSKVVVNLCAICGQSPSVLVTSRSSSKEKDRIFLCGTVLNAKSGSKENTISAEDFIRLRQAEMTLIAQHKYGVRVTTDSKWKEFLTHLGESAVAFELLQAKPSSAVKINFDNVSAGSSKGAAFILYNCARLETIIRTYNDKVEEGIYPPLPCFENADFTLLSLEDEWNLVFNYILGFPSVLAQCTEFKEDSCDFRPHHICNFLSAMVRVFSQYYRRTRILVEPRKHLLPVIHARIHMLKILNDTLKSCLKILNIKSVSQMYIFLCYFEIILN